MAESFEEKTKSEIHAHRGADLPRFVEQTVEVAALQRIEAGEARVHVRRFAGHCGRSGSSSSSSVRFVTLSCTVNSRWVRGEARGDARR
ncbi:MAG: hypothetical protein RL077_1800 [Verrucomicrobiota bacterium]